MVEVLEMVKNSKLLEEFELEMIRREKPNFRKSLKIVEALYWEARELGVFPLKDPLDGIEVDIQDAKALNRVR